MASVAGMLCVICAHRQDKRSHEVRAARCYVRRQAAAMLLAGMQRDQAGVPWRLSTYKGQGYRQEGSQPDMLNVHQVALHCAWARCRPELQACGLSGTTPADVDHMAPPPLAVLIPLAAGGLSGLLKEQGLKGCHILGLAGKGQGEFARQGSRQLLAFCMPQAPTEDLPLQPAGTPHTCAAYRLQKGGELLAGCYRIVCAAPGSPEQAPASSTDLAAESAKAPSLERWPSLIDRHLCKWHLVLLRWASPRCTRSLNGPPGRVRLGRSSCLRLSACSLHLQCNPSSARLQQWTEGSATGQPGCSTAEDAGRL